jgi:hypothetical protein
MESRSSKQEQGTPSIISIASKGWNQQWCQELTLFPPMAKLGMIYVNPKQLLKH